LLLAQEKIGTCRTALPGPRACASATRCRFRCIGTDFLETRTHDILVGARRTGNFGQTSVIILAASWRQRTFVFRPRQAAQARETRCLLGGNEVLSPRGAVEGNSGRNTGRVMLFRFAVGDSIVARMLAQ
jgi:hypothetical protein